MDVPGKAIAPVYFDNHGDLMVPRDYVIPSTENVPKAIHGLKLGRRVDEMRGRKAYLSDPKTQGERREWLNSLGFMYHTSNAAIHLQRSGMRRHQMDSC